MRVCESGDKYFEEECARLGPQPWMLEAMKANPGYVFWGPGEDYMSMSEKRGWDQAKHVEGWQGFGPWGLDDLNECVNFYFEVERDSKECETCGGNGYHPRAQRVVNTFYAHQNEEGEHWNDKITQDEVQALVDAGRLYAFTHTCTPEKGWAPKDPPVVPTAAEVNAAERGPRRGLMGHDGINRCILINARLKRLGIPKNCPTCDAHGRVFIEDAAHLNLVLWILHPRKGCSRGVRVNRLAEEDLPKAYAWLREARDRNAARFSRIPNGEEKGE